MIRNIYDRIMDKVLEEDGPMPTPCWIWLGGRSGRGYGQMYYLGIKTYVHRIMSEIAGGPIPSGLFALHKCDNPPCCNPSHLFLGTLKDNAIDRNNKGRQASHRGILNGRVTITEDQVREIRHLHKIKGLYGVQIAEKLDISRWVVYDVLKGRRWEWLID